MGTAGQFFTTELFFETAQKKKKKTGWIERLD
jgi:hypothetical protein